MSVPIPSALGPQRLLQVIELQTEIARLGLDLGGVMALVAQRSQDLTRADGAVIKAMAERIQGAARQADTVARMGRDEFAVLLETADQAMYAVKRERRGATARRSPTEQS